jgi:hypothetical protein
VRGKEAESAKRSQVRPPKRDKERPDVRVQEALSTIRAVPGPAFVCCKPLLGRAADVSARTGPFSQRLITLSANR